MRPRAFTTTFLCSTVLAAACGDSEAMDSMTGPTGSETSGDGDSGDGDSTTGDGTTGDGDGTTGDGDGTTTGDGDGLGIVYMIDPTGLVTLDLETGDSAQLGTIYPDYTNADVVVSPNGDRVVVTVADLVSVIDTATGLDLVPTPYYTGGVMGWVDDDSVLVGEGVTVHIRSDVGVDEASYSPQSGGYGSRWPMSPDGTKFAVTEAGTGRIKTFPVSGGTDFIDNILLSQDCAAPTWLGDGTMVGVCINSQEFYYAHEGDTDVTRVALNEPDYDVIGSTIWTGNDRVLVYLRANGTGGSVGNRLVVIDSNGTQVEDVDWLASQPIAGLLIRNIQISKDDSAVIWSDQGPELWKANIDGSGLEEFLPVNTLVLEFDWDNGK